MTWQQLRDVAIGIIGGLLFFVILLSASIYLGILNVQLTPQVPWYPIPVFALVIVAILLAHRQWDIGLTLPSGMPWGRIYAFAVAITVAGFCISALQGAYNGMVRGTEGVGDHANLAFEVASAFTVTIAVAALAEAGFRGIMLPRLLKVMGVWPAIIIVGAINTVAHRWEDYSPRWLGLFVLLAGWGYLRHMSGSLIPPLVAHVSMNIVVAIGFWFWGPWDQGAMGVPSLVSFAVLGVVAFGSAIYFARGVQPPP